MDERIEIHSEPLTTDPMGLTKRMNREFAEMLQKGDSPKVASAKIQTRKLLAYVDTYS